MTTKPKTPKLQPGEYARVRQPNEPAQRMPYSKETYRTGDGDVVQHLRENSDHSKYKSRGCI